MNKVLITYGSWTGATRTVAEAIAQELEAAGREVEVRRAKDVRDMSSYSTVLVGISVHMGRMSGEVRRFVRRHRKRLSAMPVAYFVVCLTMAEDTPESRQATLDYLEPLRRAAPGVEPLAIGLFAGAVLSDTAEYRRLFPLVRLIVGSVAGGTEDARDWEAIRAWTQALVPQLHGS